MNELFLKEFDSNDEDEEYVPDKKELEETNQVKEEVKKANTSKVEEMWKKLKAKSEPTRPVAEVKDKAKEHETKPVDINKTVGSSEKETNLDEEIRKALEQAKEKQKKIITESIHFAGQKYEYTKEVNDEEMKKLKDKEKKITHKGLDSMIEAINKKKNVSSIDKSKRDWKSYVDEKKIERELNQNRKDGYLNKKIFIEETNQHVIEANKANIKRARIDNNKN